MTSSYSEDHIFVEFHVLESGRVEVEFDEGSSCSADSEVLDEETGLNGEPTTGVNTLEWSSDANYMRDHMAKLVSFTPDLDVMRLSNCDSVTDHVLKILSPLTNLTWLDLSRCNFITDEGMPFLKAFHNLEHLDLDQCTGIGDEGVASLCDLTKLTYLDLGRPPKDFWLSHIAAYARQSSKLHQITDSSLESILTMTGLEWLSLSFTDISSSGLLTLSQFPKLERLELNGCDLSELEPLKEIQSLKFLSLRNCESITDSSVLTIGELTNLMGLDLGGCDFITDDGLEPLMSLQELHTLSVARCKKLTHDGLIHIGYLYNLRHLDLSGLENLFGYGLENLSQLSDMWWLNLTGNKNVTDDGLKCLTTLTSLKLLGLGGCVKVTLPGLNDFLPHLKNLAFIDLSHTPRIRPRSKLEPLREKYTFVIVQSG